MNRTLRFAVLALCLAVPAFAAETTPVAAPVTETPAAAPEALAPIAAPVTATPARKPARALSPLAVAMNAVVESEKAQMEKLQARLVAAKDPASVDAVQREIEQLKFDSEIQLLSLQATNHRQNGRLEAATRMDEAIRSLREAQFRATPPQRPVTPVTTSR